ncbi:kelch domain-containing protein 4-like [Saccoglossus kowalevskii]|uniref:Kelch domain-containing protein 4-like n=1 Tax=Saccoglossus kowalevskii TaxID=10224 RepID=A0ABM0MBE8_SACKO|nr:PREDICTED: kelch domain-containing protein 4-like [Saccoglossus kowalevskii]
MGKKNKKKDKKGYGAEKTAAKTAKKAEKRAIKELGIDEDIDSLIAEFVEIDRRRVDVVEKQTPPPSPRCNMTLTAHPDKEELILFGGEFFNGKQTFMYNDLYFYNIKKNSWTLVKIPNAPPPRCSHQAVGVAQSGGQLWMFGGEFASPTQSKFHHYKDLWILHLSEKRWEKISAPGAPSSRSGHRMVVCKRQLIVFGGFHESIRYYGLPLFDDLHAFNLDTYNWIKLAPSGVGPTPRSGCQLSVRNDGAILVYGGYTKKQIKKDVDKGVIHEDMYILSNSVKEGKSGGDVEATGAVKWKWNKMSQSGIKPSPRSGATMVVTTGNKVMMFGGVFDQDDDDDDENIESEFYNEMYSLDLEKGKWFEMSLKSTKTKKKRRRRKTKDKDVAEQQPGETDTSGDKNEESDNEDEEDGNKDDDDVEEFIPCARMNTLLVVKHGILYLYGGVYEIGDKEVTLNDMYSIDVHKFDKWNTLVAMETRDQDWEDEDSSSSDEDKDDVADESDKNDDVGDKKDDEELQGAVGGIQATVM